MSSLLLAAAIAAPGPGDDYKWVESCGTLVVSETDPNCLLYAPDSHPGEVFGLGGVGTGDLGAGDRAYFSGWMRPCDIVGSGCTGGAEWCIYTTAAPDLVACETISTCGEVIWTLECTMFQADNGEQWIVGGLDPFAFGDRVSVRGDALRNCYSFCQRGSGCILNSTVTLCCACNWNDDGAVDSSDFFAFLGDFFAGAADIDQSGATDSSDFFAFLNCFFDGCIPQQ